MSFNYEKCKVMHFGKNNKCHEYLMELGQGVPPHIIEKTLIERDLGLMISNDLKWVSQIDKATTEFMLEYKIVSERPNI